LNSVSPGFKLGKTASLRIFAPNINNQSVKNLSIVLNIVLLVLVAILYIDKFSGGKSGETGILSVESASGSISDLKIAYINSDSLLSNYDYFKDINAQLEEKGRKLQSEFNNRASGLQREIESFQRTADGMTIAQARAAEEDLLRKQQNLQQYEQSLSMELRSEEAKLTNELYDVVAEHLAEYGKSRDINIILTYTKGSGVIYANEGLDITKEAIKGLNEKYAAKKAAGEIKK
jgi:outer membrane protein